MTLVLICAGLFIFLCFTAAIAVAVLERRDKRKDKE